MKMNLKTVKDYTGTLKAYFQFGAFLFFKRKKKMKE